MKRVDEQALETNAPERYRYLREFIGFDASDEAAIHAAAPHLAPLIPAMVDQTYDQLLGYDCTARHFLPRQHGYDGETPDSLEDLTADHKQIQFRKEHLARYLMQIVGHAYNDGMVRYLDMVGKIHTPAAGSREIDVPLGQMNALMGLLSDLLVTAVLDSDMDA
ncbi:MAG: protoglobin family protein [Planctomycetales bacterium]